MLALANAPVGPTSYSPALTGLRAGVGEGPTLVLASRQLLADEHGTPYIAWELRGGRVCIEPAGEAGGQPPPGVRFVDRRNRPPADRPFHDLRSSGVAAPYVLWERPPRSRGHSPCPADRRPPSPPGPPR